MHPAAPSTTTDCSSNVYGVNCTSTTPPAVSQATGPSPEAVAAGVTIGLAARGIIGLVHRAHERAKVEKQARIADFIERYNSLVHDYNYGDQLIRDADARGDVESGGELRRDEHGMWAQIEGMRDSVAKMGGQLPEHVPEPPKGT